MKRAFVLIFLAVMAVAPVFGQDATQQQIDKLSGQIQDLLAAQSLQTQRLDALEKAVNDLRDKVNTPQVSDSASRDDLKQLASQVQEIDKKRQADRDLILKEIESLGKIPAATGRSKSTPVATSADNSTPTPAGPQKGYEYKVQAGDTVSAIAKAYRAQGVKVSVSDIMKANPKLDPAKLYVGQKVFIPDPNAK